MFDNFFIFITDAIGLNTLCTTMISHMLIRGIIIYFYGITIARFNKKLLGIRTPFNFILFAMLGSVTAGAIINEKLFIPILVTNFLLVFLNASMTFLAFHFSIVENFIKGSEEKLIKKGKIQWNTMKKNLITKRELLSELHNQLHTHNLKNVETAYLTSNGSIDFVKQKKTT
jgi:uncharacterized membrane protein YcaP (DUF421 family)